MEPGQVEVTRVIVVEGVHVLTDLNVRTRDLFGPQAEICTTIPHRRQPDELYL